MEDRATEGLAFIDHTKLRYGRISDIRGPALFFAPEGNASRYLITAAETPIAIALTGERAGFFNLASEYASSYGAYVEGVGLDIDPGSALPASSGIPTLSAIRNAEGTAIYGLVESGYASHRPFIPWSGAGNFQGLNFACFANWNIVLAAGSDRVVLHSRRGAAA